MRKIRGFFTTPHTPQRQFDASCLRRETLLQHWLLNGGNPPSGDARRLANADARRLATASLTLSQSPTEGNPPSGLSHRTQLAPPHPNFSLPYFPAGRQSPASRLLVLCCIEGLLLCQFYLAGATLVFGHLLVLALHLGQSPRG